MNSKIYTIEGMDCADCALKIEKGVKRLAGADNVQVDFATALLKIEGDVPETEVRQRVEALGYRFQTRPVQKVKRPSGAVSTLAGFGQYLFARLETRLALLGGALLLTSLAAYWLGTPGLLVTVLQLTALVTAGYPIARSGLAALWLSHDFNINLLMTIAAIGAVILGDRAEAATLIFLFAVAEALEGYTTDRARSVLGELHELAPSHAIRIRAGQDEWVPVQDLKIGERVLIKPGERIPVDGQVERGESEVNQAPITGESQPVEKQPGSGVFAGTINGSGVLEVIVTHTAQENTLNRIIQMVEEAQSVRAPAQRMIDRFARVYTPAMMVIALLVAVVPPLLWSQPFFNTAAGERGWLYRALTMLVISCPCALVISAPVTVLSAITAAARKGVLIKGGAFLELLGSIKVFAFDKTGTLTLGQPELTLCRSTDCAAPTGAASTGAAPNGAAPNGAPCQECDQVLGLAYSLEKRSSHPLARAVVEAAEQRGLENRYPPAQGVTALAGRGLQGHVSGRLATIGSHTLFDLHHPHDQEVCDWARAAEDQGQTAMLVSDGERVRGVIAVSDPIRSESRTVMADLRRMGLKTIMLTGDNETVARRVAQQVGIDTALSGLLPEDKVSAVRRLSSTEGKVAMVGDGINDTPALAAADIGIAMGGASSAQALETADVVLMAGDLEQLPFAIRLAAFANQIMRANIAFSLLSKLVFIGLAMAGITSMWLAVAADMGVSLLVTLNGLRPLHHK